MCGRDSGWGWRQLVKLKRCQLEPLQRWVGQKHGLIALGLWGKDVVLDKAAAAVVADISKLVSSSSNSK